jgi:hypothetical protein
MTAWIERQKALMTLAEKQLFFVGGAPRSGTTWVQQILDAHPEISCQGEGLFQKHFAEPLEALLTARGEALAAKNQTLFAHTGGYPLPEPDDADTLLGTAVLMSFLRQSKDKPCRAVGEKTPENVFFYPRLRALFPRAKLIAIARDPRDVLTSAWHLFHRPEAGEDEIAAKFAFIRLALPSLADGMKTMIELAERHPGDVMIVTYEGLRRSPQLIVSNLYRFLGAADAAPLVADCIARTSFAAQSAGRSGGFFRKGIAGDWPGTLTPEMGALIAGELGWSFPRFGWKP